MILGIICIVAAVEFAITVFCFLGAWGEIHENWFVAEEDELKLFVILGFKNLGIANILAIIISIVCGLIVLGIHLLIKG